MTVNRTELGIQWSLPYLKGSLSVLVKASPARQRRPRGARPSCLRRPADPPQPLPVGAPSCRLRPNRHCKPASLPQAILGSSDGWGFIRPFQWSLWLAVGLTLLLLPPLVLAIELLSMQRRTGRSDWAWGLGESLHRLL